MYMKKSTLIISCFAGISMLALAGCGDSSSGTDAKGPEDEGKVICDFDDDDLWIVQEDGDYGKYRYHEWHGDSVTVWWVKENGSIFGTNTTKQDKAQTLKDFKKKCTEYKDLTPKEGDKEEGGSSSSSKPSDGCIVSVGGECKAWACSKEHTDMCTDEELCEMGDKDYCEEEDDDDIEENDDDDIDDDDDDDDGPATTTVTCDFDVTDNEWEVVINNDMSTIYEWTGTSYKVYNLSRDDTGSADNCQSTLESFGSTFDDASCEGSVFVGLTMMSEQGDCDESCREQVYEAVKQRSCSE